MSNEPKWESTIDEDNDGRIHYVVRKGEGCDGTFLAESKDFAILIADKLNALESENAELRIKAEGAERLANKFEADRDAWTRNWNHLDKMYQSVKAENAELRERLNEAEVGLKLSEAARIAKYERTPEDEEFCRKYLADKSTSPRTDADGLCKWCDGKGIDLARPQEKCGWCYGDGKVKSKDFYCADWNRVGTTCEQQCNSCYKTTLLDNNQEGEQK